MKEQMGAPIGIFDSGIGGLTVVRALAAALPSEDLLYVGDTAHLPYGEKSLLAVREYALRISEYLYERGCKLVVIACNTASAAAREELRRHWAGRMRIVDVISPLVEDIAGRNFKKIGVIATKATIRSDVYARSLHELRPDVEVYSLATSLLAQMIEEGFFNNQISRSVLHQYLSYPDFEDIEALLLACTHYPIVRPEIEAYFGERVRVFDSVDTVVERVRAVLAAEGLLYVGERAGQCKFYVSDYTHSFQQTAEIFYKKYVPLHLLRWQGERLEPV